MSAANVVTCSAPVNIAVIKYWGKKDEDLILPINSSLSATLNQDDLKTVTSAMVSTEFTEDEIWLNGEKQKLNDRVRNVLNTLRKKAPATIANQKVLLVSENNFPTAAGLASSASGYCCMVYTLAQLFGIVGGSKSSDNDQHALSYDVSTAARVGSGSACRSIFGGWVKWDMGVKSDGTDSIAVPVLGEHHWPEIEILICVASDQRKHTGSTVGMQQSVETSKRLKERVKAIPERMVQMEKALTERDFHAFSSLAILDSDDMHACCEDTEPSIVYINDTSRKVQAIVKQYNKQCPGGKNRLAYTFDAGPNAVLFFEKQHREEILSLLNHYFPGVEHRIAGKSVSSEAALPKPVDVSAYTAAIDAEVSRIANAAGLKYILHTNVGDGPRVITDEALHLIDSVTHKPKRTVPTTTSE